MGDLCKEFVDIPLGSVIYHEKFAGSGRSRLDKSAEVSACKRHMPDTCAFVSTRCKSFLGQLLESRKENNRILLISDRWLVGKWSGQCAYVWKQISEKICPDSPITVQVTGFKYSAANLFGFPVIRQKDLVMSEYKHVGIWHVSFTCRYPYAFV